MDHELDKGALARARRADDKDKLALVNLKVNVVEGLCAVVIGLVDAAELDERLPRPPDGCLLML